jgi:hypothetical protein
MVLRQTMITIITTRHLPFRVHASRRDDVSVFASRMTRHVCACQKDIINISVRMILDDRKTSFWKVKIWREDICG